MSSRAASVRAPPALGTAVIVPVLAFTSVPVATVSVALYASDTFVSSISPGFVKPVVTVKFALLPAPDPSTRSVAAGATLRSPLMVVLPCATNVPEFTRSALTVPDTVVIVP